MYRRKVKVQLGKTPNSRRDVNSANGYTMKILPGGTLGLTPVLNKLGTAPNPGFTREEFEELIKDQDYDYFVSKLRFRVGVGGRELHLDQPKHMLYYKMLLVHPWVANDPEKYNPAIHVAVLIDEEAKAEEKISLANKKVKAYGYLDTVSMEEARNLLYLYGFDSRGASDKVIKNKLIDKADEDLDKFIGYINDDKAKDRMLLAKLFNLGVIRRNGASYFYGDEGSAIMLGHNEELAVEFLRNPKNQELKMALISEAESL